MPTKSWLGWGLAGLLLLPFVSFASITCTKNYSGRTDYVEQNVSVLGKALMVSALRDLPVGSVLFRQYIFDADTQTIGVDACISNVAGGENIRLVHALNIEGALPAVVGQYQGLNVYSSGVSGIGVVVAATYNNNSTSLYGLPDSSTTQTNIPSTESRRFGAVYTDQAFELLLVKVGDISPGVWSVAFNYPAITRSAQATNATGVTQDYGYRWNISGSVNVVAGTCQTPDVTVPMGEHSIAQSTTTEWVDFNINLLNCPPMYGRYNRNASDSSSTAVIRWRSATDYTIAGTDMANSIGFLLNPVSGYQTLAAGGECAALTDDTDMAKGMCLEIQNRDNVNVLTNSKANTLTDSGLTLLQTTASYAIPLRARYARNNESTLRAGRADTAVEFTINYQ
ncbi:type 1 fimbrial protein [Klebsiella sp. RHBSTW-00215]|uniref:fimbrial protein n=1 Tax=Klebsiella sp. RHBSTW-00215 TaxID=2742640 RepID=UPI0015F3D015|nr:type 1 fimbrial protein [Klebsiella sp. RHBSTW-00215]MBA7931787.1 type 1 fimbrial protein [Klebsiella sp. RHBSTW-00215]